MRVPRARIYIKLLEADLEVEVKKVEVKKVERSEAIYSRKKGLRSSPFFREYMLKIALSFLQR